MLGRLQFGTLWNMLLKSLRIFYFYFEARVHVQCGDSLIPPEDGILYVSVWVMCSVRQFGLMSFASVRIAHDHYASEQQSMSFGIWHYDSWSDAPWNMDASVQIYIWLFMCRCTLIVSYWWSLATCSLQQFPLKIWELRYWEAYGRLSVVPSFVLSTL